MLAPTRGTSGQVWGGGADVEHWRGEPPFSSSGGATGDSEEIDQLILHRDDSPGSGDPIRSRGSTIAGEISEVSGHAAEPEHHLGRQSCPGNR
jgi:hypothetical protein